MEGGELPFGGTLDSSTSDTAALGAAMLQQTTGIQTNNAIEPFWGSPTTLGDCLEANYAYSPYIAEFYSVLTCIPWLILPLYGMALSSSSTSSSLPSPSSGREGKKGAGRQTVFWCHVLQLSAGISGVIFHTTLSFYAQLLDRTTVIGWLLCVLFILRSFNCGRGGRGQARGGGVLKVGSLYSLIPARFSPFKPPREYASGRSGGDVQNQPRREGEHLLGTGKRKERLWPYLLAAVGAVVFACFDLHAFYFIGLVAIILYSVRPVVREHKEFKHLWDTALLFAAFAIASYLLDLVPPSSSSSPSTSTSTSSSAFSFFFFSSFFDSMTSVFYSFFPYSHSLWHLLALYSTWVVTLFLLMVELERKGNYRMEVQYVRGIYPYTVSPRRFSPSSALFIDVADF